ARLLLVGTYRPVEVILRAHPLKDVKQDLELHRQCEELELELLTEAEVGQYLAVRLGVGGEAEALSGLQALARALHRRTDGHPLFRGTGVDALIREGVGAAGSLEVEAALEAVARAVPESLRQVIEQQIERLSPEEQHLLEAASVVGIEWSVAAVAAGLATEVEAVEPWCARLARRGEVPRAHGGAGWAGGGGAGRALVLAGLDG